MKSTAVLLVAYVTLGARFPMPSVMYGFDFDASVAVSSSIVNALKATLLSSTRPIPTVHFPIGGTTTKRVCGLEELQSAATASTTIVTDTGESLNSAKSNKLFKGKFCGLSEHAGRVYITIAHGKLRANFRHGRKEYYLKNGRVAEEKQYTRKPDMKEDSDDGNGGSSSASTGGFLSFLSQLVGQMLWSANKPVNCLKVGIDTDVSYTTAMGGRQDAADYIVELMTLISGIYARDLGAPLHLGHTIVRTDAANDPYAGLTLSQRNTEMRRLWRLPALSARLAEVNLVSQMSSTNIGGGRALEIGGLWSTNQYCTSGGIVGNLNSWDIIVVAHEIGHVVGAHHTHTNQYPGGQIDRCGDGVCPANVRGTLMSYCHQCAGGLNNMDQRFHGTVVKYLHNQWSTNAANILEVCIGCVEVHNTGGRVDGMYILDLNHKTNNLYVFKRQGVLGGNQYYMSKNFDGVWNIATRPNPSQHQRSAFVNGMPDGNSPVGGTVYGWGSFPSGQGRARDCASYGHCVSITNTGGRVDGVYLLSTAHTTNGLNVYKREGLLNGNQLWISKNFDGVFNVATSPNPSQHARSAFINGMPNSYSPIGGTLYGWGSFPSGQGRAESC